MTTKSPLSIEFNSHFPDFVLSQINEIAALFTKRLKKAKVPYESYDAGVLQFVYTFPNPEQRQQGVNILASLKKDLSDGVASLKARSVNRNALNIYINRVFPGAGLNERKQIYAEFGGLLNAAKISYTSEDIGSSDFVFTFWDYGKQDQAMKILEKLKSDLLSREKILNDKKGGGPTSKVYIVDVSGGNNFTPAEQYGKLVPCSYIPFEKATDKNRVIDGMSLILSAFNEDDFLLLSGSPVLIAIAFSTVIKKFGAVKLLCWNRDSKSYIERSVAATEENFNTDSQVTVPTA